MVGLTIRMYRVDMEDEHAERLSARIRELMAESGLSWSNAWHQAQTELGKAHTPGSRKGCVVAAWVVGLPLTTVGVLTFWAIAAGQVSDLGAIYPVLGGLFFGLPLLIFAIGNTFSAWRRSRHSRP